MTRLEAQLVDESEPDGLVVLTRDGVPHVYMPRADYDSLRAEAARPDVAAHATPCAFPAACATCRAGSEEP